ncbi:hypothetical protein DV736_g5812, partial [Chaetothyriales sp. CBS 134916]
MVYMIDYGLAILSEGITQPSYESQACGRLRISLVGTCRYANINGHLNVAPSWRDDLESLGYMALYFLHGSLPWQGLQAANRQEKYKLVFERKKTIPVAELCHGMPAEFAAYMGYVREMDEQKKPDYKYLRQLFNRLFRRNGFEHDNVKVSFPVQEDVTGKEGIQSELMENR